MSEFNDEQWAIILGGSSGLGLASAKKLASKGMSVCIVHRDRRSELLDFEKEIEKMRAAGAHVKTFNRNALDKSVRREILSHFPQNSVRLLLHSIAKGSLKQMTGEESTRLSKEDLTITTHAMATSWYEWANEMVHGQIFTENARNIAFTSEGNTRVWPGYAAVSAAKSVLESLMRHMAVAWASYGLRTNCIQAGTTQTPSFKVIPGSDILAKKALERNPFGKLTQPDNIANAVYLLCKPETDWINGTILKVDGGESLR